MVEEIGENEWNTIEVSAWEIKLLFTKAEDLKYFDLERRGGKIIFQRVDEKKESLQIILWNKNNSSLFLKNFILIYGFFFEPALAAANHIYRKHKFKNIKT